MTGAGPGSTPPRGDWSFPGRSAPRGRTPSAALPAHRPPGCGSHGSRGGESLTKIVGLGRVLQACQWPSKAGFRFSRNARVPSRMSSVEESSPKGWPRAAGRPPGSSRSRRRPPRAPTRTASGPCSMMPRTSASASAEQLGRRAPPGSPARCDRASAASIIAPVRSSSSARPLPTRRGSRTVPP